jgi:para-nitrobenzyl esterase
MHSRPTLAVLLSVSMSVAAGSGISSAQAPADPTRVESASGPLQGTRDGDIVSFKGIPYAQPPVGDLRWRPPQPVEAWSEVRDATAFGPDCLQPASDSEVLATTPSEDCLYLNVWAPASADPGDGLPVLVWIHGGGYVGGGSSSPFYDGSAFAHEGLVVVSLNYRLGRLGFFAHPALLAEAGDPSIANLGYQDQLAALRWVQQNVAAFGGDPERVTVMGESAGGGSVVAMMTSPLADGLSRQAVVMSGGGRLPLVTRQLTGGTEIAPSADQVDATFAAGLGITGDDAATMAALRALPGEQVADLDLGAVLATALTCVGREIAAADTYDPGCRPPLAGTPSIDGVIVTDTPEAILTDAEARGIPVIIGTTAADLPEYFPPSITDPYPFFGEDARAARDHYRLPFLARAALVFKGQSALKDLLPVVSIGADMTMHEPARFVARRMTALGAPAWLYRFTYTAQSTRPDAKKQAHAGELPFLFGTLEARYPGAVAAEDARVSGAFTTYVANFVRNGDPNGNGLPTWPAFDPAEVDLLDFTLDDGPVFGRDPRARGIRLVEKAVEAR